VTDLLTEHFPDVVDYQFTARMEDELDDIAEGKLEWQPVVKEFFEPLQEKLTEKMKTVENVAEVETEEKCPECGKPLIIKLGRFGKFLACSGFPECKFRKPLEEAGEKEEPEVSDEKCPKCSGHLVYRKGRFGKFLGCENFPKCDFTKQLESTPSVKCPNCKDGQLVMKRTRRGKPFWGCSNYPKCKTAFWNEPVDKKCPQCKAILTIDAKNNVLKCTGCDYQEDRSASSK
jgi:DNA topoisomerase-1